LGRSRMKTFLFVWNPRKWDWTDLEETVEWNL